MKNANFSAGDSQKNPPQDIVKRTFKRVFGALIVSTKRGGEV